MPTDRLASSRRMHTGGKHESFPAPLAYAVEEGTDVSHELGEQGSVLLDFRLAEEGAHVVVDLDAVGAVAVADLFDDRQPFLSDLGNREVETRGLAGIGGVFPNHVFRVLLLEPGEHVAVCVQTASRATLVDAKAAHDLDVLLVGAVDDHLEGIEAVGNAPVRGSWPARHHMIPWLWSLTPSPHRFPTRESCRNVEPDASPKNSVSTPRPQYLVHGLPENVPAQGRVVAVHEVVPRVVVVDQLGFLHVGSSGRALAPMFGVNVLVMLF